MKQFRNLPEMISAPEEIKYFLSKIVSKQAKKMPFEELFGGNVFIVETLEDLKQIEVDIEGGTAYDTSGQVENVTWSDNREWVALHTPTSDSGGAIYFVPSAMVYSHRPLGNTVDASE